MGTIAGRFVICMFISSLVTASVVAQQPPFWNEIAAFKQQDSVHPAPAHPILFVGSSSFRKWTDLPETFPGYPVINRGFGGSTIPDVIRYVNDIIIPYHPKQVVIYCGDNDLASSDTVTAAVVFQRFKELYNIIRRQLVHTAILYVSIKPSPSREKLRPRMEEANLLIKNFLQKQNHSYFIDVYHPMLKPDGSVMDDIFLEDRLHMNAKGYAIWKRVIEPYLLRS